MKNHYLHLGIDMTAGPDDIERALQAKPEFGDAAAILLNESRRLAYNRTVSTLSSIGALRHRLGLDANQTWFVETCPDFAPRRHMRKYPTPPAPAAESAAAETTAASSPVAEMSATGSRNYKPWIKAAMIIFAIAAGLVLMFVFL